MAESTLFIPDISGFTRFVKETEINHSQHIIEELINLIIDKGSQSLDVAEVEGDAVFFYKHGERMSVEDLTLAAKKIYHAFHQHLQPIRAPTHMQLWRMQHGGRSQAQVCRALRRDRPWPPMLGARKSPSEVR